MTRKTQLLSLVFIYLFGFIFAATISPASLPVGVLVLPFIYVFGTTYFSLVFLNNVLGRYTPKTIFLLVSGMATVVLVLGSLRQLGLEDIILSVVLLSLLTWYIQKSRSD